MSGRIGSVAGKRIYPAIFTTTGRDRPGMRSSVRLNTRVVAIGRAEWLKGEGVGDPRRGAGPFRLLTRATDQGQTMAPDSG